jgi:hypothetical protein
VRLCVYPLSHQVKRHRCVYSRHLFYILSFVLSCRSRSMFLFLLPIYVVWAREKRIWCWRWEGIGMLSKGR